MAYWDTIQDIAIHCRDGLYVIVMFLLFAAIFAAVQACYGWVLYKSADVLYWSGNGRSQKPSRTEFIAVYVVGMTFVVGSINALYCLIQSTLLGSDMKEHPDNFSFGWHVEILSLFSHIYVSVSMIEAPILALVILTCSIWHCCKLLKSRKQRSVENHQQTQKLNTLHDEFAESEEDIELAASTEA
jgi:hypothetical protein